MKTIIALLTTLLMMNAYGENTVKSYGKFTRWEAKEVSNHRAWGTDACIASSYNSSSKTRVEVYSEIGANGATSEPTVLISMRTNRKDYKASVSFDGVNKKFRFIRSKRKSQYKGVNVFLAKLEDREELIRLLKARNKMTANFLGAGHKSAGLTSSFRLKGSGDGIRQAMSSCGMKVNTLNFN